MIRTLTIDNLDNFAENIYEAIIMISRRARQINELQKKVLDAEAASMSNNDNYDDEGVSQDVVDRQYLKLPKPTSVALQEMLEGKLSKNYPG